MSTKKATTTSKSKVTPLQDDVSLDPSRAGSVVFEQRQSNSSTVSAQVLAQRAATSSYVPSPYTQATPAAAEEQAIPTSVLNPTRVTELMDGDDHSNFQSEGLNNTPMHIVVNSKEAITLTSLTD